MTATYLETNSGMHIDTPFDTRLTFVDNLVNPLRRKEMIGLYGEGVLGVIKYLQSLGDEQMSLIGTFLDNYYPAKSKPVLVGLGMMSWRSDIEIATNKKLLEEVEGSAAPTSAIPIDEDRFLKLEPLLVDYKDRKKASCHGKDDSLFFNPEGESSKARKDARAELARSLCRQCPVRLGCAVFALESEEFGTWGGLLEGELDAINTNPESMDTKAKQLELIKKMYEQGIINAYDFLRILEANSLTLPRT